MIIMLGTDLSTHGGIASVVGIYRDGGLFERWPIIYLATHRDGSRWTKFKQVLSSLIQFSALLLGGRVVIVHVHSASRASFWRKSLFILLALLARKPVIFHIHGGHFQRFYAEECGWIAKIWIRFILACSAQVLVLFRAMASWASCTAPKARVKVLPNPIDCTVKPAEKKAPTEPVLLFLGAIAPPKGIYELLEAVAILRAEYPSIRLIAAGSGETEALLSRARELGLSQQIELPGWVSGAAKQVLFIRAGIFVLPSHVEAMPMSVLEAMAMGVPIVATRVGGVPDMITHDVEGVLCAPHDSVGLAAALRTVLSDPEFARRIATAARQKAIERYAVETVMAELEALYRQLSVRKCHAVKLT